LIVAIGLLMALPGVSWAGTVISDGAFGVSFVANPGETNALTVVANPGSVTITDTGAVITEASDSCEGDGTITVVCTVSSPYWSVFLDDMNDSLTAEGSGGGEAYGGLGDDSLAGSNDNTSSEWLSGGDGNDTLNTRNMVATGGPAGDQAHGGEGNDAVTGGNGDDSVSGGNGTDAVSAGDGDDFTFDGADGDGDSYDGGPGIDDIDFFGSTFGPGVVPDAFAIDLIAGFGNLVNNTPSTSTVVNFEDVSTSEGGDTVTGNDAPNVIFTAGGNDVVNPRSGGDIVNTGHGDDSADSVDGFGDRVACGPGVDALRADQLDTHTNCESVTMAVTRPAGADVVAPVCALAGVKSSYRLKAFKRGVTARVTCNEGAAIEARLVGTVKRGKGGKVVTARVNDLVLAEGSAPLGTNQSLRLKPSRLMSQLGGKRFRLRVVIDARDEFGNRTQVTKRVSVKAAKKKKATCRKKGKGPKACKKKKRK
jgi:RTX calcium-binding nonapeptide repeat (4 copies)